uniref:Putative ovule protein n=1 Tax=Solanum chacoense TaxID=4108 RepID=A0A0V0GWY9_SOLCH
MTDMKKMLPGVLCDRRVPTKLKHKFYKTINVSAKFQHIDKMSITNMWMLRLMCSQPHNQIRLK